MEKINEKTQNEDLINLIIKGNNKISSTSKTKKILAKRQKRNLKGKSPWSLVLNPHSKEIKFSRSHINFLVKIPITKEITIPKINLNTQIKIFK